MLTARAVGGAQPTYAHRVAWILTHGAIPPGMDVLHHCDNPPCVNPAHLFTGTHTDNMRDMFAKGRRHTVTPSGERHWSRRLPERMPRGERHGMARLTAEQAAAIRVAYARGDVTQRELAARYGVSRPTVSAIVTGRHWKG